MEPLEWKLLKCQIIYYNNSVKSIKLNCILGPFAPNCPYFANHLKAQINDHKPRGSIV